MPATLPATPKLLEMFSRGQSGDAFTVDQINATGVDYGTPSGYQLVRRVCRIVANTHQIKWAWDRNRQLFYCFNNRQMTDQTLQHTSRRSSDRLAVHTDAVLLGGLLGLCTALETDTSQAERDLSIARMREVIGELLARDAIRNPLPDPPTDDQEAAI